MATTPKFMLANSKGHVVEAVTAEIDGFIWTSKENEPNATGMQSRVICVAHLPMGFGVSVSVGSDDGIKFGVAMTISELQGGMRDDFHGPTEWTLEHASQVASELLVEQVQLMHVELRVYEAEQKLRRYKRPTKAQRRARR